MPELPDVELYVHKLRERVVGTELVRVRAYSLFVVRSVTPPIQAAERKPVVGVRRLGKRIVLELTDSLFLVIHLMIAGRLLWDEKPAPVRPPNKFVLAALEFSSGTVLFTEAGSKRRASISLLHGEEALQAHDPGGVELAECTPERFRAILLQENREASTDESTLVQRDRERLFR